MKILIVKLSSLGDVVHTMPAVQDICRAVPQAQIDWVVEPGFAPLVQRCAGVTRVIPCALRRWRKDLFSAQTRAEWSAFKADLQAQAYDAVIDVQGLAKSALVARLARLTASGKRYAMANATEGSGYEALTRWVAHVAITLPPHVHAVTRARMLCGAALGYTAPGFEVFGLVARLENVSLATHSEASGKLRGWVALVHGSSRADKTWPVAHWRALGQRLNAAGYGVALPHGDAAEQKQAHTIAQGLAHAVVWPRLTLDALTDHLAACVGVIGVDSGISHMAVALGLLHLQLYNFDTAWRTGPAQVGERPRQVSIFARPEPELDAVWQAWQEVSA